MTTELVEVEARGGPLDGARVFAPLGTLRVSCEAPPGEVCLAVYALAVTADGRFALKYLASQTAPA